MMNCGSRLKTQQHRSSRRVRHHDQRRCLSGPDAHSCAGPAVRFEILRWCRSVSPDTVTNSAATTAPLLTLLTTLPPLRPPTEPLVDTSKTHTGLHERERTERPHISERHPARLI